MTVDDPLFSVHIGIPILILSKSIITLFTGESTELKFSLMGKLCDKILGRVLSMKSS